MRRRRTRPRYTITRDTRVNIPDGPRAPKPSFFQRFARGLRVARRLPVRAGFLAAATARRFYAPDRLERIGDMTARVNARRRAQNRAMNRSSKPRRGGPVKYVEDTPGRTQGKLPFRTTKRKREPAPPPPPQNPAPPPKGRDYSKNIRKQKYPRRVGPIAMDTDTKKRKATLIIGSRPKRFKRIRPARNGHSLSYKYEEYATITRSNVAYVGMTSVGGMARMLKPVVAQLVRKLLKLDKIHITNHQEQPEYPTDVAYSRISWFGQYRANTGTVTSALFGAHVSLGSLSFDRIVTDLTTVLVDEHKNFDQFWDITELRLTTATNTEVIYRLNRLDHLLVAVKCFQTMDIQNQMRDDNGETDKHSVLANPLKGKLYRFSDQLPRKRSGIAQALPFEAREAKYEQGIIDTGIDTNSIYQIPNSAASPPVFNALFSPPTGKQIWNNCTGQVDVSVSPGQHKKFTTSFVFKGYLKTLLHKMSAGVNVTNYSKETLGSCTLLGLEPVMRTASEIVTLGVQKEQSVSATIRFPRLPGLPQVCNEGANFTA